MPSQVTQVISHIADGNGWTTEIVLVNIDSVPATYSLTFHPDTGIGPSIVGLGTLPIYQGTIQPSGSQTLQTDGSSPVLNQGWAQVSSQQGISGTAIFRYNPTGQEAAVPLQLSGTNVLSFPFDNGSTATGVAVATPGTTLASQLNVYQRNSSGQQINSGDPPQTVAANGHTAWVLPVDSTQSNSLRGLAEVDPQTNTPVFGLGIRSHLNAFTSVESIQPTAASTKIVSHLADGLTWKTTIILVNTDTLPASFMVNFWREDGNPFPISLVTGGSQPSVTGTIAPGGSYTIESLGSAGPCPGAASGICEGWAEVISNQSVGGTAIFSYQASGQEAAVPMLTRGATRIVLPYEVGTNNHALGVALANTSTTQDAIITMTIRNEQGVVVTPPSVVTLLHHGHMAFDLQVPSNGAAIQRGVVEFDSNTEIFALGVRSNGPAFTSIRSLSLLQ